MAAGNTPVSGDAEALPTTAHGGRGGWKTTPFIIATAAGLTLAAGGWLNNLIVFLIQEFNIKSINAAQIFNVINGCTNFFPVIAAVVADSFLGCFSVIWISSLVSLLGLILLVLTATTDSLRPSNGATPSGFQYAVLFTALALVSIGLGGTRFTLATMGANQLTESHHQATYFIWYFFTLYVSSLTSATGIVYVQDNLSWGWGFSICLAATVFGFVVFLIGKRYYCRESQQGSPFASLAQVIVASFRKRRFAISSKSDDYYYGVKEVAVVGPTKSFRLLNRAALKIEGDILPNGLIAKPWNLCSVQQVEDLKTLIRILPLWSTSILLSTPIGIQASLVVLQALTTNRYLGPHFQVPAGSMIVFTLLSTAMCLSLFDHCIWPLWKKVIHKNPTLLQQIGIGHVLNITSMAVSALIESKRRARSHSMSILWLVPQLAIVGFGEAFHFPGQVALYYQEFPSNLKSMATAMVAVLIGVGFYLSTLLIDFVRRVSGWLPDNINDGRLDNVYWVLVVIGVLNFGYFLVCSWFYKYKNGEVREGDHSV
ncbi:H+/oligopeptide symporter [Handroanthus impetiginosus]|uniref:H+/oligopeptide symporter n=1 Tax=Handroanthus impetiginosus TaxID=429701 RepID=A0A2G9H0B1_9LAMI|nr:H+/oligopeptide symporter [Handroanthus impetiginosus]